MTHYDYWLLQGQGGPYDEDPEADAFEREIETARADFRRLDDYGRARARRMAKRSTGRRRMVPAWRARQRREDVNAQVIF